MPTWLNDARNLNEAPDMLDEDKKPAEARSVSVDFQLDKVHFVIKVKSSLIIVNIRYVTIVIFCLHGENRSRKTVLKVMTVNGRPGWKPRFKRSIKISCQTKKC